MHGSRTHRFLLVLAFLLSVSSGCSRAYYLRHADDQSHDILRQKTTGRPWSLPHDFRVAPPPQSRLRPPGGSVCPQLPNPAPQLYSYQLPLDKTPEPRKDGPDEPSDSDQASVLQSSNGVELTVAPIPKEVWSELPANCRKRILEFASVRSEYQKTYDDSVPDSMLDDSPPLTLEDIVQLALLNSRAYQTQKESLYRAALRLSLERFDYEMKFLPFGTTSAADYTHFRANGLTANTLGVPSRISGGKMLATGGDLLARFANDVVLTFNGPQGFAADVSSELFFSLSHNVFQRDIQFEALTQAERDVVYAARDFARFRKLLFRDLASQYYSLLLTYRGVEIAAQDFFTNLRAFNEGEAKFRVGRRSRIQVDQVEQDVLRSRSDLFSRCNSVESSLDNLKVTIGLPTETRVNLDLDELQELTKRDEATVAVELVRRARRNLRTATDSRTPDRRTVLNSAVVLTRRLLNLSAFEKPSTTADNEASQEPTTTSDPNEILLADLLVDEAELLVQFNREVLESERNSKLPALPFRVFSRTVDMVDSLLVYTQRLTELAKMIEPEQSIIDEITVANQQLRQRLEMISGRLKQTRAAEALQVLPQVIAEAEELLVVCEQLNRRALQELETRRVSGSNPLEKNLKQAAALLSGSQQLVGASGGGLVPIEIGMDEAMLTALVQRFDLMNQQGELADAWRQIKFAGDDLKSVLNLNASQAIRTRRNRNRPFDFTWDESDTRLNLSFDTPLNRRAQRNAFRESLINYQASLRSLMQLEDNIKLAVRDDLRALQLDREQYRIAVASAALAYERVISTRLQLQLGSEQVSTRDFLEAQQAYTASINSVAREHIGYIADRIELFVDLELLEVDEKGFWSELREESFQPEPNFARSPNNLPAYGCLPKVWHSPTIKQIPCVPYGVPSVTRDESPDELGPRDAAASNPEPVSIGGDAELVGHLKVVPANDDPPPKYDE